MLQTLRTFLDMGIRLKNALLYKVGLRFPYSKVRVWALRRLGHHVGEQVYIPADITITQNFVYNRGQLTIGNRVSIAPKVIITLVSHPNASHIRKHFNNTSNSVTIEDDAWIGAGSIILNGVTIGTGAVVGAGSVVTKNVPPHAVAVGSPAKVIRYLTE